MILKKPLIIMFFILLFQLFTGCTGDQSNVNVQSEKTILLFDNAKIILNENQVNISDFRIRTALRSYTDPGNNLSALSISYVDGFQPNIENDAGTFYKIHGRLNNVADIILENVTIDVSFTSSIKNDLEIIRTKKISVLNIGVSHIFDIYLHDDVDYYKDVDYSILTITIGNQ
ncbi:MAG: hypothetical protein V1920_04745 [Bacillota bacterium]